jgi:hypothetical protein
MARLFLVQCPKILRKYFFGILTYLKPVVYFVQRFITFYRIGPRSNLLLRGQKFKLKIK